MDRINYLIGVRRSDANTSNTPPLPHTPPTPCTLPPFTPSFLQICDRTWQRKFSWQKKITQGGGVKGKEGKNTVTRAMVPTWEGGGGVKSNPQPPLRQTQMNIEQEQRQWKGQPMYCTWVTVHQKAGDKEQGCHREGVHNTRRSIIRVELKNKLPFC